MATITMDDINTISADSPSATELKMRIKLLAKSIEDRGNSTVNRAFVTKLPKADKWAEFASLTWIRTSGTVAKFKPYQYQIDLVKSIEESSNTIVLKSRQTGVSETVCSYLLCRALTEPGFAAVVFSKTQNDSSELGRRVRSMANSLQGEEFQYESDSNLQLSWKGRGKIYFLPASPRAARGIPSCSVLFLDEGAFLDGAAEIYRGALPTLSMLGDKGKVVCVSTPNSLSDWFANTWNDMAGDWNKVKIHYSQHPIYSADPNWAEKTRISRKMTTSAWNSEYECSFTSSDQQLYSPQLVAKAQTGDLIECGLIKREYVIGIDPNAGGNDYFCAIVIDSTIAPYKVVAMYRENNKSSAHSLKYVVQLIEYFNPDRVVIEKQAMGAVISEALQIHLPKYAIENFNTNRSSKTIATDRILYMLENDQLVIPWAESAGGIIGSELLAFQQLENGRREAANGQHDDSVMALAFALSAIPDRSPTQDFFNNI